MARPVAVPFAISEADRATFVRWTRRRKTAQALALRGRIVLAAAVPGTPNTTIANRFAALDVQAGTVIGEVHRRHRSLEFRHFLDTVERRTPPDLALHLILDHASSHKTPCIHRWLVRHPRVHWHCTPTSTSWLNLVEGWFSILRRRALARGRFRSTHALEQALRRYIATNNAYPTPFVWTTSAEDILASVERYCQQLTIHTTRQECRLAS